MKLLYLFFYYFLNNLEFRFFVALVFLHLLLIIVFLIKKNKVRLKVFFNFQMNITLPALHREKKY